MDHSKVSPERDAVAARPSPCSEQAARPAAAARPPTNCRLFIAYTARQVKSAASVCGDPRPRQYGALLLEGQQEDRSHRTVFFMPCRARKYHGMVVGTLSGKNSISLGLKNTRSGPQSRDRDPSFPGPADEADTGTPSMATRHAWRPETPGPACPPAGVDNVPRCLRGYGLCYWLMH